MESLALYRDLALALGIGLLIGVERGWTMREEAEGHRVAGFRTFALIGFAGGVLGLLSLKLTPWFGVVGAAGLMALLVIGYRADLRLRSGNVSATSAVAAFLTLCLGMLTTLGYGRLAVAGAAVSLLLLSMKAQMHKWLKTLDDTDIQATARYAIIAFVILPILPDRAFGPYGAWNPRDLWLVVVLVTGLSFAGYWASKKMGAARGTVAAAALGATVSSTAVSVELGRRLRNAQESPKVLHAGIAAATAMMLVRVLVLTAALAPLALPTFTLVIGPPAALATVIAVAMAWRADDLNAQPMPVRNPFELWPAVGFAMMVAMIMFASRWAIAHYGDAGLVTLLAITGLYDADSAIITIGNLPAGAIDPSTAGLLLAAPMLVNTLFKATIVIIFGGWRSGLRGALPLFIAAAAICAGFAMAWPSRGI